MNGAIISANYFQLLELCFILCQVGYLYGGEYTRFGSQRKAGINTDFKVAVPGWKEECFYELMAKGGRFEVSYLVVGHNEIDFYMKFESGHILVHDTKSKRAAYTLRDATDGTYAVCFHNIYSTFSSVVVYLSMVTYETVDSNTTSEQLGELAATVNTLKTSMTKIRELNRDIRTAQAHVRVNMMRDTNHVKANEDYVYKWSLAQCVITVSAALIQVYSIRWLFNPSTVKSGQGRLRA